MREPLFDIPGVSDGVLADVLRLDIETDPTGLTNLIVNPDGALGGYGWEATIGGTLVRSATTNGPALEFVTAASGAPFFISEYLDVTAGQYLAARWLEKGYTGPGTGGWYRFRFDYYNAAGTYVSSSTYSTYYQLTTNVRAYGPVLIPATVTRARFRLDFYANNTGTAPSGGSGAYRFTDVTVAAAATSGALGNVRTNVLTNPSFTTNLTGWTKPATGVTLTRVDATTLPGINAGQATALGWVAKVEGNYLTAMYESASRAVTPLARYYVRARVAVRVAATPTTGYLADGEAPALVVQNYNGATKVSANFLEFHKVYLADADAGGWVYFDLDGYYAVAGSGVTHARVEVNTQNATGTIYVSDLLFELVPAGTTGVRTYFDGSTPDAGGWVYDWTGTANASTSTATSAELDYIPPVPTIDVLGKTFSVGVTRGALDPGTLTAEVIDVALDPADADLIRPGRAGALVARDATGAWKTLYTGKLDAATVTYPLLAKVPDAKKARIVLSGTDNIATLASAQRLHSVATIAELPYVLEGASVPWNVNGSGAQVGAATIRTTDANATALDQVAMTRDTAHGYAWVDSVNVLQAWDAASLSATPVATLDASVYSDVEISFDTDSCINEVTVVRRSLDALGAAIEETNTYLDAASIKEWGRHAATFTVLAPVVPATFAAEVLAANATPQRRITSVTVSVRDADTLPYAHLDLYDAVQLVNTEKGINQLARITGIVHTITAKKWLIRFTFAAATSVASPQVIPPLKPGALGIPHLDMMKNASAFSIPNNAWTTPTGWTVTSSSGVTLAGSAATMAVAGTYLVTGQLTFAPNSTGSRRQARLLKGATMVARTEASNSIAGSSASVSLPVHTIVSVAAGDVLTLQGWQNTGAALNVEAAEVCFLRIYRLGD